MGRGGGTSEPQQARKISNKKSESSSRKPSSTQMKAMRNTVAASNEQGHPFIGSQDGKGGTSEPQQAHKICNKKSENSSRKPSSTWTRGAKNSVVALNDMGGPFIGLHVAFRCE